MKGISKIKSREREKEDKGARIKGINPDTGREERNGRKKRRKGIREKGPKTWEGKRTREKKKTRENVQKPEKGGIRKL